MSPKKVWGNATWELFHVLAEQLENPAIIGQLMRFILQICHNLPCPDCTDHARAYWARVDLSKIRTRDDLRLRLHAFHNTVNARNRTPPFPVENLSAVYGHGKGKKLSASFRVWASAYNSRGSPKLLADEFHRTRLINDFRNWLLSNFQHFTPIATPSPLATEPTAATQPVPQLQPQPPQKRPAASNGTPAMATRRIQARNITGHGFIRRAGLN